MLMSSRTSVALSFMILLVQYGVVGLFAVILFTKCAGDLEKSKKSLQNMYKNLETTSKLKLF